MTDKNPTRILASEETFRDYYDALCVLFPEDKLPEDAADELAVIKKDIQNLTGENLYPPRLANALYRVIDDVFSRVGAYTLYPQGCYDPSYEKELLNPTLNDPDQTLYWGSGIRLMDICLHNDEMEKPEVIEAFDLSLEPHRVDDMLFWAGYLERQKQNDLCDTAWKCIGSLCDHHIRKYKKLSNGVGSLLKLAATDERFPRGAEHASALLRNRCSGPAAKPHSRKLAK